MMRNTDYAREFLRKICHLRLYARFGWWDSAEREMAELGEVALCLGRDCCEIVRELAGMLKDHNYRRFGKLVERAYRQLAWVDPELAGVERKRR
jgi:hypothetical protein